MPDITGTNRPLPPPPAPRPKRPPLQTGKMSNTRGSVQAITPKRNLPKPPELPPLQEKSLKERKVAAMGKQTPLPEVNIKRQARDVIPEMIPGKVQPPPGLGNVKIGKMLGQGAFGRVFLARNTPPVNISETPGILQKNYVVKDQKLGTDPNKAKRRETEAHAEVHFQRHAKGAVSITDEAVFQGNDGLHHLVMMEHGGQELARIIEPTAFGEANPLDEGTCRAIGSQLLSQLSSLHQQGVIHRDIKPENVLINHQGKARLSDFGISQQANSANTQYGPDVPKYSGYVGTPIYMAPEMVEAQTYSEKADCWSMGMMLSELLTGEKPPFLFHGKKIKGKKRRKIALGSYNRFTDSIRNNPKLSPDAKNTILNMIALDPQARPSAEQALNLPFFQSGRNQHFQLQNQHQEAFRQLAHFEQMLENAETRLQAKPDETTAQEVASLERQVSAMGTEVKSLQAKMELKDLSSELEKLRKKMNDFYSNPVKTAKKKKAFSELSIRYHATLKDTRLKEQEANHLDQSASLMRQKNSLISQVEAAQIERTGRPTRKTALLMVQALKVDDELQVKELENQLGILKIKQAFFRDYEMALTDGQRTEAKEIAAAIKNHESELAALQQSLKHS